MKGLYEQLKAGESFFLMAGTCVIESRECVFEVAGQVKEICEKHGIPYVFKASFDKANRTSIHSYRGPGIKEGLDILAQVREKYQIPVMTDIHEPAQAAAAAEAVDLLQIPAFLCRQTDLIVAAAKTGLPLNLKKAQFLAAEDMKNVLKKAEDAGNRQLFLCERGSCFGYHNLVVDMTGMVEMKKMGYPVVFDATHSVQKPGGNGNCTGGNREYVRYLSRAAAAVGADGFFMEVHPDPDHALSDGPNMVRLDNLEGLLLELREICRLVRTF